MFHKFVASVACLAVALCGTLAQAQTSIYDTVDVEGTIDGMATDLGSGITKALTIGAGIILIGLVWKFGKRYVKG